MTYEQLMQLQGDDDTMQSELGSSRAYKSRAMELYNRLSQLNEQYGQAAVLPDRIVDEIHMLHTQLNHAMNEWEQHKNRARSATRDAGGALLQQEGLGAIGKQLAPSGPPAANQQQLPIAKRMRQESEGMTSMAPAPTRPAPGKPKPNFSGMPPGGGPKPTPAPTDGMMEDDPSAVGLQGARLGFRVPRYRAMIGQ